MYLVVVSYWLFKKHEHKLRHGTPREVAAQDQHERQRPGKDDKDVEDVVIAPSPRGTDGANAYGQTEVGGNASVLLGNRYDSRNNYYQYIGEAYFSPPLPLRRGR